MRPQRNVRLPVGVALNIEQSLEIMPQLWERCWGEPSLYARGDWQQELRGNSHASEEPNHAVPHTRWAHKVYGA